jgi:hypothetical protein
LVFTPVFVLESKSIFVYRNSVINLHQKGDAINTHIQTDSWTSRTAIMLGLILMASLAGIPLQMITGHPMPEFLVALGSVAIGGLLRLWISPLNQRFPE